MVRKLLLILLAITILTGGLAYYFWHMAPARVEGQKATYIDMRAVLKEFSNNAAAADAKYQKDIAVELKGTVTKKEGSILFLMGASSGIQCALRDSGAAPAAGAAVVIKGHYAGFMDIDSMVSLTDCIIVH